MSRKEGESKPTLWQSCHILQKKGQYYIVHFKQCFLLDGRAKRTNFTLEDLGRTKLIACLLQDWGLIKILHEPNTEDPIAETTDVVVLSYAEKSNWNCRAKYTIRKK